MSDPTDRTVSTDERSASPKLHARTVARVAGTTAEYAPYCHFCGALLLRKVSYRDAPHSRYFLFQEFF